jgi:hypothetical protein
MAAGEPNSIRDGPRRASSRFLKTLGGHRRYPATEIRQLADELQAQPTV